MLKRSIAACLFLVACSKSESKPEPPSGGTASPPAATTPAPDPTPGSAAAAGSAAAPAAGSSGGSAAADADPRAAGRRKRIEAMLAKLDTNGDGKLSVDELKASTGRMKFDDPAALDTNKDGDISVDELEAAMKARRGKWKKGGGSAAAPGEESP